MTEFTPYVAVDMSEKSFANNEFVDLVKEILFRGKAIRFRACGHSMSPFIRNGDVINLMPAQTLFITLKIAN